MPLKAVLKVLNLFLALGAFLAVGVTSLVAGEDLMWVAGKAVAAFMLCWFVLGWFVNLICMAVHGGLGDFATDDAAEEPKAAKGKAKKK